MSVSGSPPLCSHPLRPPRFRAWVEAIDDYQGHAPLGRLVGELASQLTEGRVGQGATEVTFLVLHALEGEVLNGEGFDSIEKCIGDRVERQVPGLGDPAVQARPPATELGPVVGSWLGASPRPIELGQLCELALQVAGFGDVAV